MADKAGFGARGEKACSHSMVTVLGREDERRVRIVELACDGEHLGFCKSVRVQYNACRIAGKALPSERIDLMNLDLPRHHSCSATLVGRDSSPIARRMECRQCNVQYCRRCTGNGAIWVGEASFHGHWRRDQPLSAPGGIR